MRLKSPEILRAYMQQEPCSLGDLAKRVECSKGFISHLLAGRRATCTQPLADRIAESFGLPTSALFVPDMAISGSHSGDQADRAGAAA